MLLALAATAGVAVANARLFDEAQRRQEWLQVSTEITRQLLSNEGEEPLQVIARRLQRIADADVVNVVLPTPDGARLMVEVATGAGAAQLTALSYPAGNTVSGTVIETGQPVLIADMADEHDQTVHLSEVVRVGPLMVLPLVGSRRVRGALVVGRLEGRPQFTPADLDMATTFANHAAVALELADARTAQEQVALLEDRDRIARDLHDHVMQRLFGAGMTVESIAAGLGPDPRADRLGACGPRHRRHDPPDPYVDLPAPGAARAPDRGGQVPAARLFARRRPPRSASTPPSASPARWTPSSRTPCWMTWSRSSAKRCPTSPVMPAPTASASTSPSPTAN